MRLLLSAAFLATAWAAPCAFAVDPGTVATRPEAGEGTTLATGHARIRIDGKGFITSLVALKTGKEYGVPDHPSPLLSLHESGRPGEELAEPVKAVRSEKDGTFRLTYANGAVARVKVEAKPGYFRFQLLSLTPRGAVDSVVWGPVRTRISKRIGDMIGVVRDDEFAIGQWGLDDNTIPALPNDHGDMTPPGIFYYIHSPDPATIAVPGKYKEGQYFSAGGDGINDVAFYSHPEEYFRLIGGEGAHVEPAYGSSLAHMARDRRLSRTHLFELPASFKNNAPHHQVSDPVDVDFIGSGVALYACPDASGLATIENILLSEGLPHPMMDGRWIRDPASFKPDIAWYGPHGRLIEYADALGLKGVQDEGGGEYYPDPVNPMNRTVDGKPLRDFAAECRRHGIRYGLHSLTMFLQPGRCHDVSPVPNPHLLTVLRTRLAKPVSATDTDLVVTDSTYLDEAGTWPDSSRKTNVLRLGKELLTYETIDMASRALKGVKRGQYGTTAAAHAASDEIAKLQMNCYHGFAPDIFLQDEYADYYARFLHENDMEYIDFDGQEGTGYTAHGQYGVRRFFRRFFETYAKLTGGRTPRVMGAGICWEYSTVANMGGNANMFDPVNNRWGIEGKDFRNSFGDSWFPGTFGIQNFRPEWSVYDVENLQAKSVGFDVTYMFGISEKSVEACGAKDAVFRSFRAWEDARAAGVFTPEIKSLLRDLNYKAHLERTGEKTFALTRVREVRVAGKTGPAPLLLKVTNDIAAQPLRGELTLPEGAEPFVLSLPGGASVVCDRKVGKGERILISDTGARLVTAARVKLADLRMEPSGNLPAGESTFAVSLRDGAAAPVPFALTVWLAETPRTLGK